MRAIDMDGTANGGGGGGTFAVGLLCGVAVGAAVGLLMAPKPGAALRNDLMKSADDLSRRAKGMYGAAASRIGGLADQGAAAAGEIADAVRLSAQP